MLRRPWIVALAVGVSAAVVTTLLRAPAPVHAEDAAPKPEYAGPGTCKNCHLKQHKSWKATGMAKTFESLKPEACAEKKTKAGLDPAKDYTKDEKCLKCHTTGYGTPSGFPAVVEGKTWTPEEVERAKKNEGVTCEACHGPGSLYWPLKKLNEKFKLAEIVALGATSPPKAEQCMVCHVKECPTMPADYVFDFEKAKHSPNIHEHVPLKHPH